MLLPALIGLVAYILVRPFDFVPALASIPFLYIFTGLAIVGFLVDLGRGKVKWSPGPHLPWVIALVVWAIVSVLIFSPGELRKAYPGLLIPALLYFLIAHGVGSYSAFSRLTGTFLLCTVAVSAACVYQGLQPFQCIASVDDKYVKPVGKPDGRRCDWPIDCVDGGERGMKYGCERVGLAGTQSVGHGRVGYTGVLHDPNETALAVNMGIPIAIARYQRRRGLFRLLITGLTVGLVLTATVMTQSRGGLLVAMTALAAYFVSRYRWKGIVVASLVALPLLVYGAGAKNRSDGDESTQLRLEAQWKGLRMFMGNPLLGVGAGRYTRHSWRTAHNSYVLTPAELGAPGMLFWAMIFWISVRCGITGIRASPASPNDEGRTWGMALLATSLGTAVGVLFLTFNYHYVLWTLFGLSGAYSRCVTQEHPEAAPRVRAKEVFMVAAANLGFLALMYVYLFVKGIR